VKIYVIYLVILSFLPVVFSNFVFAEPSLTITDCIQSHHYITFTTLASGFLPNMRILVFYYLPDSDKGWGSSSLTDSSGNWEKQEGHLSSEDIPSGTWKVEAYNVDENHNILPDSPYATTEFETPCPFPTTPPDTEVYATVDEKQISSGDSVTSNSIHFGYSIKDSFSSFARFDCKLDEGQYEDCTTIRCEDQNSCGLNPRGTVMDGNSQKEYDNLSAGKHVFMVKATDDSDNVDPTPAEFVWTILGPIADAGLDQTVKSNDLVQLDGSNSSDPGQSVLTYLWSQTEGPKVILNGVTSVNPTFTAPETKSQTNLTFQLTVTNEEGITSKPDEVTVTVSPIFTPFPPTEEPQTIRDIITDLIQNPLDITNSIESSNKIIEILTDSNSDNDQIVCGLLDGIENKQINNIQKIIDC
jgi:hypothetical protein